MTDHFLTTREAAEFLRVKPETLEQWRWRGYGPLFTKVGRTVRYRQSALDAFANDRTFISTTAAAQRHQGAAR